MSSFVEKHESLWSEVASIALDEGLGLYDLERIGGGLRVFVEGGSRPATVDDDEEQKGQGGVTSGDCSKLCRRLMYFFSVEGARLGLGVEPEIEVSSPGINRRLRLSEHFVSALGQEIKVTGTASASNAGVQTVTGRLERIAPDDVSVTGGEIDSIVLIDEKGLETGFPFSSIQKARVEFSF